MGCAAAEKQVSGERWNPLRGWKNTRKIGREADSISLNSYLSEVAREHLLSREEEIELAERIADGDEEARELLTKSNLRLVIGMARRYLGSGMSFVDLIQEGNLGLLEAVAKFDPAKGCRFSTYACWWIRQAISRALANKGRTVRLPVHIHDIVLRYSRLTSRASRERESVVSLEEASRILFPVSAEQVARQLKKPRGKSPLRSVPVQVDDRVHQLEMQAQRRLKSILTLAQEPVSLESPVSHEVGDTRLGELIPALDCEVSKSWARHEWEWLLAHLNSKELRILKCRYGLADEDEKTLNQLAAEYGVSRESIRQLEVKAIKKLREAVLRDGFTVN